MGRTHLALLCPRVTVLLPTYGLQAESSYRYYEQFKSVLHPDAPHDQLERCEALGRQPPPGMGAAQVVTLFLQAYLK